MIVTDLYVQSVVYLQWISDKHHVAAVYVEDTDITIAGMPYNLTIQYSEYAFHCRWYEQESDLKEVAKITYVH